MINSVLAVENSMTLLAVKETDNGFEGGTAELTLEITDGKGRVFLETSPLTKIDTQVSTRLAKEIACKYLETDCSNLDFVYTIKSSAPIVGGPSAGAAMSALTVITLLDEKFDQKTAMTGTINSGGIVGPVSGIKEKIEAAKKAGIKKVLIPIGESITEENNETFDLIKYAKEKGIIVKEIGILNDALTELLNKELKKDVNKDVEINEEYNKIMKQVSKELCDRTKELIPPIEKEKKELNSTINIVNESKLLYEKGDYYSAASKCFSANIRLNNYANEGISEDLLQSKIKVLIEKIKKYDKDITNKKINTIPKLQTFMIVKERINEASTLLNNANLSLNNNETVNAIYLYSYSEERFNSAISWSKFFEMEGKELELSQEVLKESCQTKTAEAEERYQYVMEVYPIDLEQIKGQIEKARTEYNNRNYALCLNSASLAKANSDSIISSMGTSDEEVLKQIVDLKLKVAKNNIIKEQERGFFPIIGYSYYEYSSNLKNESIYSSLLFSQYALELSSFDVYFTNNNKITFQEKEEGKYELFLVYVMGILTGVIITYIVLAKHLDH